MADDEVVEPQAGELTTANYGWVKPNVGASDDVWGGYINGDLDGIDTTVKGVSNVANAAYPASNPAGYQTAAQVTATLAPYALTASVPAASSTIPAMDGTAAVGAGTTWARADHVHPSDTSRLAISGGTMTGPVVLAADPVAAMQPATKQYVDGGRLGDNRIINGDMRIDQRNNGASGTATGYTVDRWVYNALQASKGTWARGGAGPPLVALGFGSYLSFASSSAYASLTTDAFTFTQPIEADMVSDFAWGTANAQPVTLSFLANSTLAGTFSGSVKNFGTTRSYPFSFSLAANTWTKIVITIPGDTVGTWVMSGNGGALYVVFDLGCGTNFRTTAGAWAAGNYNGVTGAVSVVGTNAATFNITGVKLEIGSVATPFNRQSLARSMADCQRYFETNYDVAPGTPGSSNGLVSWGLQPLPSVAYIVTTPFRFSVAKRASPTMVGYSTTTGASGQARDVANSTDVPVSLSGIGMTGCQWIATASAATTSPKFQLMWTANAEL